MDRRECGFSADAKEIAAARRFAYEVAEEWGIDAADIVLVVSELATNAVRHAGSSFSVCLALGEGTVQIEVSDADAEVPRAGAPAAGPSGGRGLLVVERLARSWGSRPKPGAGKVVRVELAVRRLAGRAGSPTEGERHPATTGELRRRRWTGIIGGNT